MCRRSPTAPARTASSCARRPASSMRPAGSARRSAAQCQGRNPHDRIPDRDPVFERDLTPYVKNLRLLGIDATMRIIDAAQYQRRLEELRLRHRSPAVLRAVTPGMELRVFFGAESASNKGSFNLSGIAHSGRRRADRQDHHGRRPRGTEGRRPRARPGAARRALLGAQLAQGRQQRSPIGTVRPAEDQAQI